MIGRLAIASAIICLAALTATPVSAAATYEMPAPNPRIYRNWQYGFSVRLPKGLQACVGAEADHGVTILLDRRMKCESYDVKGPIIGIWGDFDIDDSLHTIWALAHASCPESEADNIRWIQGQSLGGQPAASCRVRHPNGSIKIRLNAIRKGDPGDQRTWSEVEADLFTTVTRLQGDSRVFQSVLKGIVIDSNSMTRRGDQSAAPGHP